MSFRPLLRRRAVVPTTAGLLAFGTTLFPKTAFAEAPASSSSEEPSDSLSSRKPIYDDFLSAEPSTPSSSTPTADRDTPTTPSPTPTDRLAVQVGRTRLFLHAHVAAAEDSFNDLMTNLLHLESSFTSTVASLAPSKESGERLMPGAIYVVVAAMAGSIVTRNRNIMLRASLPLAIGIGAGWAVLPVTSRNVGDLIWTYETRVPFISNNHMRIRGATEEVWRQARVHGEAAARIVDEKVQDARESVQDWVKKGR
ncbi:MAG: hypothetical protein M1819_002666 [Sarea resinae]|nr:MAG: hypothetical protein M1819_002666 [Sarea resinae]